MTRLLTCCLLTIALLIAVVTRFYQLGTAPAGLYLDEAGQGYSAYALLQTGRDEFGKVFPIVFRSFTDFKTPVYIYLLVPLIPIFDLTTTTVRLPSAIFSLLTFPVLYYLVRLLAPKSSSLTLAVLSLMLLAISPWHILFGRTNFECNVALFFLLTGILYFYKALYKPDYLALSAFMFAIAVPAYHSQRLITPLVVLFLVFKYRARLLLTAYRLPLIKAVLVGSIVTLPTLAIAATPGFLSRAATLNIISNQSFFSALKEFSALYSSYFSPRYMFFLGDYGPRSSYPELSAFFLWQLPFYLYGLYKFITAGITPLSFLVLTLFFVSPLPAALTRDPYTTIRALPLVIPQTIIISYGIIEVFKRFPKRLFILVSCILISYSLGHLYSSAFILNEHYRAPYWDFGWHQVVTIIKSLPPHLPIVVDSARNEPYIHLLFFLKFDPRAYAAANPEVPVTDYYTNLSRLTARRIGRIAVRGLNWEKDLSVDQYLIGDALAISLDQIRRHNLHLVSEITYPDGSPAFRIVKTQP